MFRTGDRGLEGESGIQYFRNGGSSNSINSKNLDRNGGGGLRHFKEKSKFVMVKYLH